jgi:hypothetical protein
LIYRNFFLTQSVLGSNFIITDMKRIFAAITISILITLPSFSQEEEKLQKLEKLEKLEKKSLDKTDKDTVVTETGNQSAPVKDSSEETRINIGNKEIRISESGDRSVWRNYNHDFNESEKKNKHGKRFQGHLGGIEFGFNGYLTDFWSTSLKTEDYYLDLNTTKSNNFNLIFPGVNIGITRHLGFVTALGLNFNNYRFDGNNSITKNANGVIEPFYPEAGISYSRSKLATTYGTLPVLLEAQIPVTNGNTINLAAGVIGAVKLGSHTKVVYYSDGKEKEKRRDDFSLNTLRYGVTARAGYGLLQVYGTCYLTPLFETGKGPKLYPFEIGIAFTFND